MEKKVSPLDFDDLMKISEIANKLKVNGNTITRWINNGYFPNAFRAGKTWRIPKIDVENYILRNTEEGKRNGDS